MNAMKIMKFLNITLLLTTLFAGSSPAAAQGVNRVGILSSGLGCQWSTISAAIAAASSVVPSTILIEAGQTFTERLGTISKPVTIVAGNATCTARSLAGAKPVIDAANLGRVATISGDVTFQYVEIRNGEVTDLKGANLLVTGSGDLILDDVLVAEGVLNMTILNFNTFAAGIHVESGGSLVMRGASDLFLSQAMSGWGVGGLVVEAGATATLEDTSRIGEFLVGNSAIDTVGGALVQGTLILADDAEVSWNVGDLAGGIWIDGGNVELRDHARIAHNVESIGMQTGAGGIGVSNRGHLTTGPGATPTIEGNQADNIAGGIRVIDGTVDLSGISISSNTADGCGAGMYIDDALASVSLEAAVLDANVADECGGGIALFEGDLTLDNVEIINNQSGTDGGGLYLDGAGSVAEATAAYINSNWSRARGGGIAQLAGASLTLHASDVSSNSAVGDGGGLFVAGTASVFYADGGSINRNSAGRGGGVYAEAGTITIDYQKINGNEALSEGGALRVTAGATVDVNFGHVKHNTAGTMGGGFAVPGGRLDLFGTDVFFNEAGTDGGAGTITLTGFVTAQNTWFHFNQATGRGGAWAVLAFDDVSNPRLVVDGDRNQDGCLTRNAGFNQYCSEFRGNSAAGGGGAIFAEDGTITVEQSAFLANTADAQGSAVLLQDNGAAIPNLTVTNTLFANNGLDPAKDIVRVAAGSLRGIHLTSADNIGVPFHFGPNAAGSLRWSIIWDAANVVIDTPAGVAADCSMFRAWAGVLTGGNYVDQLDPFFVTDLARGDYRLDAAISINAVDKCFIGLLQDLDSHPRPDGPLTLWDRGSFEAP
jgi:predicted outer membrane repeat protein